MGDIVVAKWKNNASFQDIMAEILKQEAAHIHTVTDGYETDENEK